MKIHIITIFPDSFNSFFNTSIIKNGLDKGKFEVFLYKLNDFSHLKTLRVDDKAYGMHGQVLLAIPLSKAINHIFDKLQKKVKVVYMSPSGDELNQEKIEKYFLEFEKEDFIIICGHYEGVDQRIIDKYVDYKISIGQYIITSGELASQVFIDSLVRLIPGVLGNEKSYLEDSFSKKLNRKKEYPVYSKPEIFEGLSVPKVLLSGNHKEIEKWKFNNLT